MKGQCFIHEAADPRDSSSRIIRLGTVIGPVGPGYWLVKTSAKGYTINNVMPTEALCALSLFDSERERSLYMLEAYPPKPVELPRDVSTAGKSSEAGIPSPATPSSPPAEATLIHDDHGPCAPGDGRGGDDELLGV